MNRTRYQALLDAAIESQRLANTYSLGSLACLGWALTGAHLSGPVRLILSGISVSLAWIAKESRALALDSEKKASRFRAQIEELDNAESALEFANAKVSLEESYGLVYEPETPALKTYKAPPIQESKAPESWDFYDDFGLEALAPDAKEEIRSWLSLEFACSSKVICAASGSGKSSYLRWEYRQARQDRTTYLIDGHLLGNHLEGTYWTGSKESDLRVVSHTDYQITRTLTDLIQEVKDRLQGKKSLEPIHILIDESDGTAFKSETIKPLLFELTELVANEARKTKVTLTLVTHSIQKQKTGLDASDLCQISWLVMGNALCTPYSRWPGDLDPKVWRARQTQLQETLDSDQARACVLYTQKGISLEVLELNAITN